MKLKTSFVCQQCGYETPEWYGKCPSCSEWNSLVETVKATGKEKTSSRGLHQSGEKPHLLSEVTHIESARIKTGFGEFDRVLGGGIVPGSVTLLSGDPGIGKSTLLLHVIGAVGGLYVSGEESAEQIKLRAHRLGIKGDAIMILSETHVESITAAMQEIQKQNTKNIPMLVVIDSIQTLQSDELEGMPGSVGQVRSCAERITTVAKGFGISVIIIGHVTKDGAIAGPKILEHMVDTVLYLEGERFQNARLLRTLKNRFGAIEEVGIFEMNEKGLKEIDNPSALFLEDRVIGVPGSVITVLLEGTRPILVEIQALVVSTQLAFPRRVASGFDGNRLQLIVAILQKRLNIPLGTFDIFINVSGGLKVQEPAADLAVSLAILSSFKNIPIDAKSAVFGEVGLLGEVRRVGSEERRIKEAKRLGFTHIISPASAKSLKDVAKILG
ncbi:MAG: DNA repair protein RadA [Patescibacteria group bacterium]